MRAYKDYSPTSFDGNGFNLPDNLLWEVVPVGRNRDTEEDDYGLSNFHTALEMLEETGDECLEEGDWGVARFGHWACGWFEIVLVKPDTSAHAVAIAIEDRLDEYPILDEEDWSKREMEYNYELAESFVAHDLEDMLYKHGLELPDTLVINELTSVCDLSHPFYKYLAKEKYFNLWKDGEVSTLSMVCDIAFMNESSFSESTVEDDIDIIIEWLVLFHGCKQEVEDE